MDGAVHTIPIDKITDVLVLQTHYSLVVLLYKCCGYEDKIKINIGLNNQWLILVKDKEYN
jgi:hypothetical protein